MLRPLGELLREVLLNDLAILAGPDQVSFQAPDGTFRGDVPNHPSAVVNVYLADLRENRRLRSNERTRSITNGTVQLDVAPDRVDCHYLISAWTATQPAAGLDPALEEHAILYEVIEALSRRAPLNPSQVYAPADPALSLWPAAFQNTELPTALLPAEGFSKLSEFWTTMGSDMRWKPVVYLVVTVPLVRLTEVAGGMVTTMLTDYRLTGVATSATTWIEIGGGVRRQVGAGLTAPLTNAWVRLETPAGVTLQQTRSDGDGRFRFQRLRAGTYRIVARAVGLAPDQLRVVTIPSETGEYDLVFP